MSKKDVYKNQAVNLMVTVMVKMVRKECVGALLCIYLQFYWKLLLKDSSCNYHHYTECLKKEEGNIFDLSDSILWTHSIAKSYRKK